jgi:aryl-alcohol dehydrogenase-like predicted oxidoreductase
MQYAHLVRSGLSVSHLYLGATNFGPQPDDPAAHSIMDFAQEAGINFFNMANRLDEISPGHKTAPKDSTW